MRTTLALALTVITLGISGCAAETPASPEEECRAGDEHVRECIAEHCATASADDPLCVGGTSPPPSSGACDDADASSAARYVGVDCDTVVADLALNGGKGDGFCPSWLCWLCDCEEESTPCCVDCASDPLDEATCEGCFLEYGRDTDGDGMDDQIWNLYCTSRCNGCVDTDCDGSCD
jgi:hypothetical protein